MESHNNVYVFLFKNKAKPNESIYVYLKRGASILDMKKSLLNSFDRKIRSSITDFKLVTKDEDKFDKDDTIKDNFFDEKYNNDDAYDYMLLLKNSEYYETKNNTTTVFFRAVKLVVSTHIFSCSQKFSIDFPLAIEDNSYIKWKNSIKENAEKYIPNIDDLPYNAFQNTRNLDEISKEEDMKKYSKSGLILFLFPIKAKFLNNSKITNILLKFNKPLEDYLTEIFKKLKINSNSNNFSVQIQKNDNSFEIIDTQRPIHDILKKQKVEPVIFEIIKQDKSPNYFFDEEDEKFFKVLSKISDNNFTVSYKIVDTRTDQLLCKKVLNMITNEDSQTKIIQKVLQEFEILYKIDHPSICKAIGIDIEAKVDDSDMTTIAVFLEFQEYSLSECLNNMNNTLKTKIVIEIAHAMNFIHKHGLIYRDLKIDNIRLNNIYEAKLINFELIRIHECLLYNDVNLDETMTKKIGTLGFMSPEMMNDEDYDYKTDVYSFGVVLYCIFVGSLPKKINREMIKMPEPSQSISKVCIDIISKCLLHDPSERPSFEEILQIIRENSYALASHVDRTIISRRDKELLPFDDKDL